MSTPKLVSVVLPVRYVREDWLRQSIESVLTQDYPNKELIVVNDEATQDIDALVAGYGIRKYIKNGRNRKLPYSLNRGFEQADGEYHTWTSADNYMLPGMLSRLVAELDASPRVGIVFGYSQVVDEDGRSVGGDADVYRTADRAMRIRVDGGEVPGRFAYLTSLGACFLYRAGIFPAVGGYDERLHGAEDYDFWIRASRVARMARLPRTEPGLYAYRIHEGSMSATIAGCFTKLRLGVLGREVCQRPWDVWLWRAMAFYLVLMGRAAWQGRRRTTP